MDNKTLYLHVGFHKTASSSIQMELYNLSDELLAEGYHYPKCWRFNHNFLYGMFCNNPVEFYENVFDGRTKEEIEKYYHELNNLYLDEISLIGSKKLILSSEDLSVLEVEGVKRLKEYMCSEVGVSDFKIVFCVRNPISFAKSDIQQSIKVGYPYDVQRYESLYSKRILNYIEVFGRENILIYEFEKYINHTSGPIGGFLESVGASNKLIRKFRGIKINESYSQEAIDLMEFINSFVPISDGDNVNVGRVVNDTIKFSEYVGSPHKLPGAISKKIIDMVADDLRWLKDEFSIDYNVSLDEVDECSNSLTLSDDFLCFLYDSFADFTVLIKKLVILYLVERCRTSSSLDEIEKIVSTLFNISSNFNDIVRDLNYQECISRIQNATNTYPADLIRDLGCQLEEKGMYQIAYQLMMIASLLRPDGEVIKVHLDRLKKRLQS